MLSKVYTAGVDGIDGFIVDVECDISNGMTRFDIVGLPDASVKEARDRVRAAMQNAGFYFPEEFVIVNLAPADRRKEGTSYDLGVLLGLIQCSGGFRCEVDFSDKIFIGEMSLGGEIRSCRGVLNMCMAAKQSGFHEIFVPSANAREAAVVDGINVYPVGQIKDILDHLTGEKYITPAPHTDFSLEKKSFPIDFSDIKGQENAKRAMEIAAAGGHHILLVGSPGVGKSMLAKRLPTILPDITFEEALETTRIYSAAGMLEEGQSLLTSRPFRAPHHTASGASLAGGGKIPTPGEISLSHNGVLFLDELPEFSKSVTEVLRQPMEDNSITISRAGGRYTFPATFMLCAAMNPCKCGYYGHPERKCTCKSMDIQKYLSKISGPLLDRIDIQIEVPPIKYEELSDKRPGESSAAVRARVMEAREFAAYRTKDDNIRCNAQMTSSQIRKYCSLTPEADELLKNAFVALCMSARGHDRILRVARTIADTEKAENIRPEHIAEAIQFRSLDRKYWERK